MAELSVAKLDAIAASGPFVGIAMYTNDQFAELAAVDPAAWRWLVARNWIVSVNDACRSGAPSGWPDWEVPFARFPAARAWPPAAALRACCCCCCDLRCRS